MSGLRLPRLMLALAVFALSVAVAVVGLAWATYIDAMHNHYCDRGDSDYGELTWSRVPPGPVCTWVDPVDGSEETRGPTPVMSIWLLTLAVGGVSALKLLADATGPPTADAAAVG